MYGHAIVFELFIVPNGLNHVSKRDSDLSVFRYASIQNMDQMNILILSNRLNFNINIVNPMKFN